MIERSALDRKGAGLIPASGPIISFHSLGYWMTDQKDSVVVNLGYAQFQLAKAFLSYENADDITIQQNAAKKIEQWQQILQQMIDVQVKYGSRTPLKGVPAWVTLEVATGGFATGNYLAGGSLQEYETTLLSKLPFLVEENKERLALNSYFLSEQGISQLTEWLNNAAYDVKVPEEGALLTVAYLLSEGKHNKARALVEKISPWFAYLRFYPIPLEYPKLSGTGIRIQNVEDCVKDLYNVKENYRLLAQKEAIEIWAPFKDRLVALFLETFKDDLPCQLTSNTWQDKATTLLSDFKALRKKHPLCGKVDKKKNHFYQLKAFLQRCLLNNNEFHFSELTQITFIIKQHIHKHGYPSSIQNKEYQQRQQKTVASSTFYDISKGLIYRFESYPKRQGLDDINYITLPITLEESELAHIPQNTQIPKTLQKKLLRCLNTSLESLIELDLVTSGEVIARLLPQLTAQIGATGIQDARLRGLYAQIYKAFRCRRSLLLLNLEKQVQLEELPWIEVIDHYRQKELSNKLSAKETLIEVCTLTLASFPYAILPNKLLQELTALAKTAELGLPLTEELAADIFMGAFSDKFIKAIEQTAISMQDSLYAHYYNIDYNNLLSKLQTSNQQKNSGWVAGLFNKHDKHQSDILLNICEKRAGVKFGNYQVAETGMLLEQVQILSTHNLVILFNTLGLQNILKQHLPQMVKTCFIKICKRLQMPFKGYHAALVNIKQSAYAWRQMVFYLSFLNQEEQKVFFDWAINHLAKQKILLQDYISPLITDLIQISKNNIPHVEVMSDKSRRIFWGWSNQHWLLEMVKKF